MVGVGFRVGLGFPGPFRCLTLVDTWGPYPRLLLGPSFTFHSENNRCSTCQTAQNRLQTPLNLAFTATLMELQRVLESASKKLRSCQSFGSRFSVTSSLGSKFLCSCVVADSPLCTSCNFHPLPYLPPQLFQKPRVVILTKNQ